MLIEKMMINLSTLGSPVFEQTNLDLYIVSIHFWSSLKLSDFRELESGYICIHIYIYIIYIYILNVGMVVHVVCMDSSPK